MAVRGITIAVLIISLGFFALAFDGSLLTPWVLVVNGLLGLVALRSDGRGSSFLLALASLWAAWGVLEGANALVLSSALIATVPFWILMRTPRTDAPQVGQPADLFRRLGILTLLSAASVALALYLPLTLSFPVTLALTAFGAGALLVALRSATTWPTSVKRDE